MPLNQRGISQAKALAEKLQPITLDLIYASDLIRCRQTAEFIMTNRETCLIFNPALRELDFGSWEGLTYNEALQTDETRLRDWYNDPYLNAPPGGETLQNMGDRFDQWLGEIMSAEVNSRIACVTHGGIIRYFISRYIYHDLSKFWSGRTVQPAGFVRSAWDGSRWSLLLPAPADRTEERNINND